MKQLKEVIPNTYLEFRYVGNDVTGWISFFVNPIIRDGKVIGLSGAAQDITEKKLAEEKLRESEEKYHRIADNVTDVVWVTDLEMNPIYVSPSVERVSVLSLIII